MKIDGADWVAGLPKGEWTLSSVNGTVIAHAVGYRPFVIKGLVYTAPKVPSGDARG